MFRLLCLSFLITSALAQTDTAALSGLVTDPSGASVSDAAVRLQNTATGSVRSGISGSDGRYQFTLLAPGEYEISAEAKGFKKFIAS